MLGYSEEKKTYRLFDPIAKKCYIHRDIIFKEKYRCMLTEIIKFIDNR